MTGPPIDPSGLIAKLGPNFDYSSIDRIQKSPVFGSLPQNVQDAINGVSKAGVDLKMVSNPAAVDRIGQGAYPTPVTPTQTTPSDDFAAQAWSVVHMIPGVGILSQIDRAISESKNKGIPFMDALGIEQQRTNNTSQEFLHQLTAGIVSSPTVPPEEQAAFNTVVKPTTALLAMGLQVGLVTKAIGMISKIPAASNLIEQLPQRMQDIGMGMASFGVIDALRADGVPSDPSALDPSGSIAAKLKQAGVPDRLALFAGGSAVGGILGASFLGISRGIEWGRSMRMAATATPEQLDAMRAALGQLGYTADMGTSKIKMVNRFVSVMTKVNHDEALAGLVSDNLSREEWIAQTLYGSANLAQDSEEARYVTGLMRGQPGQVSVATGISDPSQVVQAGSKLGLNVDIVSINRTPEAIQGPLAAGEVPVVPKEMYDVLISRPNYVYTSFDDVSRQTKKATQVINAFAKDATRDLFAKQTNDIFVLADGSTVRGGFTTDELAAKIKPQVPIVDGVPRPDLGIKEVSQMVNMTISDDNKLTIDLPRTMSQEQFNALGPAANTARFDQVILKAGPKQVVLNGPLGQQVQDAAAKLVPPIKTTSKLTTDLIKQFKATGVFNGQAAVLHDGTLVTVVKKFGGQYIIRDPLTADLHVAHPDKITILPASAEAEQAPSNLFNQYLKPEEQQAFAKYRLGMLAGLDQPIEKYSQLAKFANSRGFIAGQVRNGFTLTQMVDGEALKFKDLNAATTFVRKSTGPMPDLTPDVVRKVLGGQTNVGFILPQGTPPQFGEMMPIPHDIVTKALVDNAGGRGPGALEQFMVPMRGLTQDLDKRYGTSFYPLFANIQSRQVARQNFETLWYFGKGGKLPEGVMPLERIMKVAGADANQERITNWLEAKSAPNVGTMPSVTSIIDPATGLPDPTKMAGLQTQLGATKEAIEATMTPGEKQAAPLLKSFYNALFNEYGIEANYVEDYAPRIRERAPAYGNNPQAQYQNLVKDPLKPTKGAEFWADNYRTGALDVYDQEAFRVAARYLTQGASNRFMKEPIEQAAQMVAQLGQVNKNLALPMGYFMQAVKGTEFSEQRVAISESMQRLLESIPGGAPSKQMASLADKLTTFWMGAVYTSTMAFRPGLALRNIANSLMMSWPLFGGNKGRFLESLGAAVTRNGMEEAIRDGAISLKTSPILSKEDVLAALPEGFDKMAQAGFSMYDSADEFTRAHVYWAARLQSEDAIAAFAKKVPTTSEEGLARLKATLIADSGMHMQDSQIVDEFLRRMAVSPDEAARYAGKQASDVVNFLYGRGMQPRWMRGIGGRLLGQYGTWPMWYLDYLRRVTGSINQNSGAVAAATFLAKHALINASVAYAGKKALDVELGKWMVYPALFYSGGPGFQVAMGLSTLARGLSNASEASDDPYAPARISSGVQLISQTLPSMVPFWFAAQDAVKLATATDPTDRVAALLGTQPTAQYTVDQKLKAILGQPVEPFSTSSAVLGQMANGFASGTPVSIDPYQPLPNTVGQSPQGLKPVPPTQGTAPAPHAPAMVAPAQGGSPLVRKPQPGAAYRNEATNPAESRPIPEF